MKTPNAKGKARGVGRPKAVIDLGAVEGAASIGCTTDEIAAVLGVSHSTFCARKAAEPAIAEAVERGQSKGRATLRRLQWQGAQGGNATMLIWLGKQMLGQKDRIEQDLNVDGAPIVQVYLPSNGRE